MKKLLLFIALTIFGLGLNAQNVGDVTTIDYDGYSLEFTITSVEPAECEVRCGSKPTTKTTLTIPDNVLINETSFSVTSIPDSAFLECNKFTGDLVIPNTVKSVGIRAFRDCTGFTGSLTLSENLETIGDLAFAGGGDIEVNYTGDLIIPNSVTYIGLTAFQNCSKLTGNLTIPNGVTSIGDRAFYNCSSLTGDLIIPNSVTYIGQSAFWECVGFDGILTLPKNLDTIHAYTFGSYDIYMNFTKVEIPETVKYIGKCAFQKCSNLENVTFGENSQLTYIGDYAFTNCNSLPSIEIPSGVTYIGQYGLNCSSLKVIKCYAEDVPETGDYAFNSCPSNMVIFVPKESVGVYMESSPWNNYNIKGGCAYYYNGYLLGFEITDTDTRECKIFSAASPKDKASLTIPSSVEIDGIEYSVTSIGEKAFYYCKSLTSIEIPNSVTSIGGYAFSCSSLTSVTFGKNSQLTSIGERAFYDCSSLTSIEIPNSVTSIGDYAFRNCSKLRNIICYAEDVPETGDNVFYSCPSNMVIFVPKESVDAYKESVPWKYYNIVTEEVGACVYYSYNVYLLGFRITDTDPCECEIFYASSPNVATLTIPSSVGIMGQEYIVTSIGDRAFYNCSSLTGDLIIPNTVTSIGDEAFSGDSYSDSYSYDSEAPEFTSITFSENSQLTFIGDRAFYNCLSLTGDLVIPNTVTSIGDKAFSGESVPYYYYYAPRFKSVTFGENSQLTIGESAFYNCKNLTSVTFGENSQLTIGERAFYNCSSLTSVTFGKNSQLTTIGKDAFSDCSSLTSVTFGENSQLTIGESAFYYCKNLTSVTFGENSQLTIGESAFSDCSSLTSVTFGKNSQLTSIGNFAFSNCSSLTGDLFIPNSVTSIGACAFSDCSSLTSLTFGENYQLTSIGKGAFSNCSSLTGDLVIPNTVTSIGEDAFLRCTGFTSIVVEEGNTVYDSRDNCNALIETATNTLINGCDKTIIPNSVTSIKDYAFYNCKGLSEAKIPSVIKYIGASAFEGCTSLKIINMEDCNQLSNIAVFAFSGCSSLEMVVLPKYISSISVYAFYGCSSLKGINIPEYVTEIGSSAFSGCSNLNSVKCYATSVPTSPEDIFDGVPSNMTIQVPGTSMASYLVATPWKNYILTPGFSHQITVVSNNSELGTVTGSGTYDEGVVVTLTATVNGNNEFDCWTEDGVIVSKEMTYTFNATRDRVIIGNFRTDDTPQNVVAKAIDSQSIELTWNAIATASSYNVYRDGELLKNVNTNSYLDEGLEANTKYCYTITTVRASGEESEKSTEACAKTMKENSEEPEDPEESIEELSSSIKIYPNPVENELFLATELRVEEIAIYDVYGRHTMSQQANETTSQQVVEVADLEAGVYFMKVVTNEGEIVKRFVKK